MHFSALIVALLALAAGSSASSITPHLYTHHTTKTSSAIPLVTHHPGHHSNHTSNGTVPSNTYIFTNSSSSFHPGHSTKYGNLTTLTNGIGQPTATVVPTGSSTGAGGVGVQPPVPTATTYTPSNPGSKLGMSRLGAVAGLAGGVFMIMA